MTLPSTGQLNFSAINTEFGLGTRMSAYRGRWYVPSGGGQSSFLNTSIAFSAFRGSGAVATLSGVFAALDAQGLTSTYFTSPTGNNHQNRWEWYTNNGAGYFNRVDIDSGGAGDGLAIANALTTAFNYIEYLLQTSVASYGNTYFMFSAKYFDPSHTFYVAGGASSGGTYNGQAYEVFFADAFNAAILNMSAVNGAASYAISLASSNTFGGSLANVKNGLTLVVNWIKANG